MSFEFNYQPKIIAKPGGDLPRTLQYYGTFEHTFKMAPIPGEIYDILWPYLDRRQMENSVAEEEITLP